ncbi:MAG: hypothetical protein AB2715_05210 [Candidatus Thiodiazotropha sp.]
MKPIEVIELKRRHLARFANESGAEGEVYAIESMNEWIPRPKGNELKILLSALKKSGIEIKRSSFDAISHPDAAHINFAMPSEVETALDEMVFIEIKTANQERVKDDFTGFFFALTESEIAASEILQERHKVALFNKRTGVIKMTTVPEIISCAKSTNWQVSVQL